jgi:predicted 3-demethylubiquinone-9 3-methyltransferase (glyoxalase superfamily)
MPVISRITPCLWFDDQAEDAANFYTAVFPRSRIVRITRYGESGFQTHGKPAGTVMSVAFELMGQSFLALNGGPALTFNEAVSLQVGCDTQAEIDRYWELLRVGGDEAAQQRGWLKDRFGLSWQVVPNDLAQLIDDPESVGAQRAMQAMMNMKKLDIEALKRAHDNEP